MKVSIEFSDEEAELPVIAALIQALALGVAIYQPPGTTEQELAAKALNTALNTYNDQGINIAPSGVGK